MMNMEINYSTLALIDRKMKNILFTILLLITISRSIAQRVSVLPNIDLDKIEIQRTGYSQTISINDLTETIVLNLGYPETREEYYYEMSEKTGELLKYSVNDFYIMDGEFYAFDLRSSDFRFGTNGNYISVGESIDNIESIYPEYLNIIKDDHFTVYLKVGDLVWDSRIIVEFDPTTRVINRIMRYDP